MTMNYEHDYDGPDLSEDEIHDPLEEGEEPPIHMIYGTVYDELRRRHRQAWRDAEDESIETLEAGAQILADRQAKESVERERAWHEATADLIRNHKAEVERLRELVESAYHEGWRDSCHYAPDDFSGEGWGISDAKRALEGDDG